MRGSGAGVQAGVKIRERWGQQSGGMECSEMVKKKGKTSFVLYLNTDL